MNHARVEVHDDHLLVKLEGLHGVGAFRRSLVVPYSTISSASIESPHWPGLVDNVRVGTFVPRVLALGAVRTWQGERRLYDIDRSTTQALTLRLEGHPEFDRVELDVQDAARVVEAVAHHRPEHVRGPPARE